MPIKKRIASLLFSSLALAASAKTVGNLFDDPEVGGVACYLSYSDHIIDGSPKNSVTAVPVPAELPIPVK